MNSKYEWDGYISSLKDLYKSILLSYKYKPHKNGYLLNDVYVNLKDSDDSFTMEIYSYDSLTRSYLEKGNLKVYVEIKDKYTRSLYSRFNNRDITPNIKTMNKYVLGLLA